MLRSRRGRCKETGVRGGPHAAHVPSGASSPPKLALTHVMRAIHHHHAGPTSPSGSSGPRPVSPGPHQASGMAVRGHWVLCKAPAQSGGAQEGCRRCQGPSPARRAAGHGALLVVASARFSAVPVNKQLCSMFHFFCRSQPRHPLPQPLVALRSHHRRMHQRNSCEQRVAVPALGCATFCGQPLRSLHGCPSLLCHSPRCLLGSGTA